MIIILLVVSLVFMGVNLYIFFNYNFEELSCTKNINEDICYNDKKEILKDPENEKKKIFKEYKDNIEILKKEYKLPDFNLYTAYYYSLASNMDYTMYKRNESLNNFFNDYSNTYNLEEFYKNNTLFYQIFLPYKML